jgi:hypothetical protein
MNKGGPEPWVPTPFWILFWRKKSITPPELWTAKIVIHFYFKMQFFLMNKGDGILTPEFGSTNSELKGR